MTPQCNRGQGWMGTAHSLWLYNQDIILTTGLGYNCGVAVETWHYACVPDRWSSVVIGGHAEHLPDRWSSALYCHVVEFLKLNLVSSGCGQTGDPTTCSATGRTAVSTLCGDNTKGCGCRMVCSVPRTGPRH